MAFTEFYCQSGGSNLNGGSDTNNAAKYTSANGGWVSTTFVFTPNDGSNPVSAGVAVGDFASVYIDGATVATFIARVVAVVNAANGTITVSSTARSGTTPSTSATARSIKVGGAWKGPNGGVAFPFTPGGFNWNAATNSAGNYPRFNLKNDAVYSITTGLAPSGTRLIIQGYSSTPGDGGKATIDAGGTVIGIIISTAEIYHIDLIVQNNGTTGASHGFSGDIGNTYIRCVANNIRGNGFNQANTLNTWIECEAYACNKSNSVNGAGFLVTTQGTCLSCIAHDNVGSNTDGFKVVDGAGDVRFDNCIADSNGRHGFAGNPAASGVEFWLINCDAYNNVGDGVRNINTTTAASGYWIIRNSNFVKNGGYGINSSLTTGHWWGLIDNCGFGRGTQANGSGDANNLDMMVTSNNVAYANDLTPYSNPASGKFDLVSGASISHGRGVFTTTQSGYGPTIGYVDIGAASADATPFGSWAGAAYLPDGYLTKIYLWEAFYLVDVVVTVASGALPPGLSIVQPDSKTYQITGVPTALGTYPFILRHTAGPNHTDVSFRIIIAPGFLTGSGEGAEGDAGPTVVRMPHASVSVRDAEVSNLVRRSKRALRAVEGLSMTGEGVSGDIESGFMLND